VIGSTVSQSFAPRSRRPPFYGYVLALDGTVPENVPVLSPMPESQTLATQQKPAAGPGSDMDFADTLWQAADALRGQVDAAEYKHVVLGVLFLKYISDSFASRRDDLKAELEKDGIKGAQLESLLESRDEYTAERVFWVPPEARWTNLQNQATRPDVATLIDDAILAVSGTTRT
jgi:type I restriction-modification system DNA methylase subunit